MSLTISYSVYVYTIKNTDVPFYPFNIPSQIKTNWRYKNVPTLLVQWGNIQFGIFISESVGRTKQIPFHKYTVYTGKIYKEPFRNSFYRPPWRRYQPCYVLRFGESNLELENVWCVEKSHAWEFSFTAPDSFPDLYVFKKRKEELNGNTSGAVQESGRSEDCGISRKKFACFTSTRETLSQNRWGGKPLEEKGLLSGKCETWHDCFMHYRQSVFVKY